MTDAVQLQPDTEEVLQVEPMPLATVPVEVQDIRGPVRVKILPNEAGTTRTISIGSSVPKPILQADHFRARAVLCSFDQDFLYAFTENAASDPSTMARQPKAVPLVLTAATQVWVLAQTGTTVLSYATERWASSE